MIRYLTWGLFMLFTLGTVTFEVNYADGLHLYYESWLEKLIERIQKR